MRSKIFQFLLLSIIAFQSNLTAFDQCNPDEALTLLKEGHARFIKEFLTNPNRAPDHVESISHGQYPIASVFCCADSRTAPEIIFDQGLGDLFVVRNAGNIVDNNVMASLQFSVEVLQVPLIVVMGHSNCGAANAAITTTPDKAPGYLRYIVEDLTPVVAQVKNQPGDELTNVVKQNVRLACQRIRNANFNLACKIRDGKVKVVGMYYHLNSGKIEVLSDI